MPCGARSSRSIAALAGLWWVRPAYFMKSPPQQFTDEEARQRTEAFILGERPD